MTTTQARQDWSSVREPDVRADSARLPSNIEAEQGLLGALLLDNRVYDIVAPFLEPRHFFEPLHGRIFDVVGRFAVAGKPISPVTLKTYFERDEVVAEIGDTYITRLAEAAVTITNALELGRAIHDLAIRRELVEIGSELQQHAADVSADEEPNDIVERFDAKLTDILHGSSTVRTTIMSVGKAAMIAVDRAAEAYRLDGRIEAVGLSTRLPTLDAKLGPLEAGMQIVIAGGTSMGKTALAECIAFANGLDGKKGLIFSQEMLGPQIARRQVARLSGVPASRIRMGRFNEKEYELIVEAARRIDREIQINIDEARNLNVRQIAARARSMKRHEGLDFIVVDYLQLLAPLNERDTTARQVGINSKALRDLSGDLEVPMLLISQLNRDFAKRDNKRPQLNDLKESGSIEQDADAVLLVHREEYYLEKSMPEEGTTEYVAWLEKMSKWQGKAEILIPKLREGAAGGTALVGWNGPLISFNELDDQPIREIDREMQEAMPL